MPDNQHHWREGSKQSPAQVLIIGRNCVDHIAVVDEFPREDSKKALCRSLVEGGGQGGTSACCVAALGGHPVLVGSVGDDDNGRFCLERLRAFDVDTRHVRIIAEGRTPLAYIIISKKGATRTIVYESGNLPAIGYTSMVSGLLTSADTIMLAPDTTYLAQPLAADKPPGVKIVYDCERVRRGLSSMMALADFFIPSHDFLREYKKQLGGGSFGAMMHRLEDRITGTLVVTCGDKGAYYLERGRLYHVPALPVQVADTLGAGDSFHGAFALAVAQGYDLARSVAFSVAAASLSCTAYGGRNGLAGIDCVLQAARTLKATCVD